MKEINTSDSISIHIRNELGWGPSYPVIIDKIKEKYTDKNKLFFTSGLNSALAEKNDIPDLQNQTNDSTNTKSSHTYISDLLNENNIRNFYYYDHSLTYDVNSAINFELCLNSNTFIGMSKSSYTHLIILKRIYLKKNNNSFYDSTLDCKKIIHYGWPYRYN